MVIEKHGVKIVFIYSARLRLWVLECNGTTTLQEMPVYINTCETFDCYFKADKELRDAVSMYH